MQNNTLFTLRTLILNSQLPYLLTMRLQLTLAVTTIAAFATGRAFDVNRSVAGVSRMARATVADYQVSGLPARLSSPDRSQPTNKFRRDRAVHGFFDDDLASDADWKKFTDKGGALMCSLNGNDEEAGLHIGDKRTPPSAASPWTGDLTQELQTWKWSTVNPTTYSCKMNDHWKIAEATKSLGLNGQSKLEGGDNACYRVEHWDPKAGTPAINQWYTIDGTEYQVSHSPLPSHPTILTSPPATNAHYEFGININGGAIFGFFLNSPIHAASTTWFGGRKPADASKLPQLRAFSDVMWGYWVRGNPNVRNIRYFFMLGVSNDETNQLIARCLEAKGRALSEWPGARFDTKTEEGHALLGSPSGAAFAYFLMQHKKELGHKTVTHVTVFRAETDDDLAFVDPHLVFHVGDVEREDAGGNRQVKGEEARGVTLDGRGAGSAGVQGTKL
ncbi:hypothetical protein N0V95_007289 [Ascochyta clinopodiicola]|nr:hypothetical protein N0V95_007289 [Ascochyta clinopodiicola]